MDALPPSVPQSLIYILLAQGDQAPDGRLRGCGSHSRVVLINAWIGYLQEAKAERAIEALAKSLVTETNVVRAGKTVRLPSTELVPGDLVLLTSGDKIRLISDWWPRGPAGRRGQR